MARLRRRPRLLLFPFCIALIPIIYLYHKHTILRQYSCQLPPFPLSLFTYPATLPPRVELNTANLAGEPRVLLTTLCTHPSNRILGGINNHRNYAIKHGYAFYASNAKIGKTFEDGFWAKTTWLEQLLVRELAKPEDQRLEWIVWTDIDTLVLNPQIPLSTILPPPSISSSAPVHLLWSRDDWGPNTGVVFLKVHKWSLKLLRAALHARTVLPKWVLPMVDQTALQLQMPQDEAIIIPQDWINSRDWDWRRKGMASPPFHVHFSGKKDKGLISREGEWLGLPMSGVEREAALIKGKSRLETEARVFWQNFAKRRHLQ